MCVATVGTMASTLAFALTISNLRPEDVGRLARAAATLELNAEFERGEGGTDLIVRGTRALPADTAAVRLLALVALYRGDHYAGVDERVSTVVEDLTERQRQTP